jgi:sugar lactone lactonase YvrE
MIISIQQSLYRRVALLCAGAVMLAATRVQAQSLNLYASSYYGGTLTEYPAAGGSPVALASGLSSPQYQGNQTLDVFPEGGGKKVVATNLGQVLGVALDASGNVFVANTLGNEILKISGNGQVTPFATNLADANGLAFNSAGDLFEADFKSGQINEFTPSGMESLFASGLNEPIGLAFDSAGNLYCTTIGGGTVVKFTPGGTPTIFGSGLTNPDGIAIDSANDVFVASFSQFAGKILEFTGPNTYSVFANLNGVAGVAIQPVGQASSPLVPEPSTWAMMGLGAAGLLRLRRK